MLTILHLRYLYFHFAQELLCLNKWIRKVENHVAYVLFKTRKGYTCTLHVSAI